MTKLEKMIEELCPDGVEYVPLWSVTIWDKRFNAVENRKQPKVYNYPYLLASDLFALEADGGDVFLLSTGEQTGWTTEELAGDNLREGEVITIPWGKSRAVTDCIKYYKGKFVTADNRIMTSNDQSRLNNKYLYYWIMSHGKEIDTFYRGSGIKHPDMAKVLDMNIPLPPLPIQEEIVRILDNFTKLTAELEAELEARKKQYEFYRDSLLKFDIGGGSSDCVWKRIGELFEVKRGRVISKDFIKENSGSYPVFSSQTENNGELGRISTFDFDGEYITWTTDGANAGSVFYRNEKFSVTNVCGLLKNTSLSIITRFAYYVIMIEAPNHVNKGMGNPKLMSNVMERIKIPVPPLPVQERIVSILDRFDKLCNDITEGLPAEIEARRKQYEYYRDKLLTFTPISK